MSNFEDFSKKIPIPSHCPFCGRQLSKENAQIDHIVPVRLGGTDDFNNLRYLCRECNTKKSDKYDHLYEYYYRLMKSNGKIDEISEKGIDYYLGNMKTEDLTALENRVIEKDPFYLRMNANTNLLSDQFAKVKQNEPSNDELESDMESAIKAYKEYDYSSEIREMINNNTFVFSKDFPINDYREELAKYGEDEQGETYSIYLDDEGRLVVY